MAVGGDLGWLGGAGQPAYGLADQGFGACPFDGDVVGGGSGTEFGGSGSGGEIPPSSGGVPTGSGSD